MHLYLHIGMHKTGTSAIQRFFLANGQALARMGVLYPPGREMKRIGFISAALQARAGNSGTGSVKTLKETRESLLAEVSTDLARRPGALAVISEELLSSQLLSDEEVEWLREMLSRYFDRIQVIIYIRRQDELLLSGYSTIIKNGHSLPLRLPTGAAISRYDHWETLSRWIRVFGRERVICRKFERASLKSQDVLDDFLEIAGIDLKPPLRRTKSRNESLDAECLEFLRMFNRHNPRGNNRFDPVRGKVVSLLTAISDGPLLTLPESELAGFMESFRDSNAKIASEFFGGVRSAPGDPLFEPSSDPRPRTGRVTLTADRAVEICAKLFNRDRVKRDRIEARKEARGRDATVRRRRAHTGNKSAPEAESTQAFE